MQVFLQFANDLSREGELERERDSRFAANQCINYGCGDVCGLIGDFLLDERNAWVLVSKVLIKLIIFHAYVLR